MTCDLKKYGASRAIRGVYISYKVQHTVHSWSTRAFNIHFILFLLLFLRKKLLLFAFVFLSSRSVEMSSYWDGNYVFGQYSSDNWVPESVPSGIPGSNEQEEVLSSIQGKQNRPFLDLNTHPPVDETAPVDDSYYAGKLSDATRVSGL
ncbi:hypothetical protein HanPSC8_Chr03g0087081 [Helianthus annuus]|nr:hypothetical protein HanPSC8_Chr03g0087081 [Helianthus annuus]